MKRNIIPVFILTALFFGSCDQTDKGKKGETAQASVTSVSDVEKLSPEEFAKHMYEGDMMEAKLGQIAEKKTTNKNVKQFGQMMEEDHSSNKQKLQKLASEKNIKLPKDLSMDKQEKIKKLEMKSGAEFDKAYMDMMVKDHKKDVAYLNNAIKELQDQDFIQYAKNTLETIKMHEKKAEEVYQMLETSASAK
jgi:putative membrane protein